MQDSLQRWPKSIAYIVGVFEEVGIGARALPHQSDRVLSCPTRTHRRRPCDKTSGGLNALQGGRYSGEQGADVLPKECDRADTNHGNQPDQHAVFDEGSAFLVTAETIDELHHVEVFQRWCRCRIPCRRLRLEMALSDAAEPRSTTRGLSPPSDSTQSVRNVG